jgi:hypothetical protein
MKKIVVLIVIILISLPFVGICEVNQAASTVEGFSLTKIFDYLVTNWVSISLIISEIAALLSAKYSGILKTILSVLDLILRKKKDFRASSSNGLNGPSNKSGFHFLKYKSF